MAFGMNSNEIARRQQEAQKAEQKAIKAQRKQRRNTKLKSLGLAVLVIVGVILAIKSGFMGGLSFPDIPDMGN